MSKGELENLKEKRKQERKRKLKSLLFRRCDSFDEDDEAKKKHNLELEDELEKLEQAQSKNKSDYMVVSQERKHRANSVNKS